MSQRRAYNAYIDEAGDEGFKRVGWRARGVEQASSEWLVLGAATKREEADATGPHPSVCNLPG